MATLKNIKLTKPNKPNPKNTIFKVSGMIERVMWSNDRWSATKLRVTSCNPPDSRIRPSSILAAAGAFSATEGESITVECRSKIDPKWGFQLDVTGTCLTTDISPQGLLLYLEKNKNFRGIGPAKAKKIIKYIVDNNLNRAEALGDEKTLMATGQLSKEQAAVVANEWKMSEVENSVLSELMKYSLTVNQAKKVFGVLGTNSIQVVNKNPYALIYLIDGVGFLTIDKIAIKNGMPRMSTYRISAAVDYALKENEQNGSSAMTEKDIIGNTDLLLNCDDLKIRSMILEQVNDKVENFIVSKVSRAEGIPGLDGTVTASYYARGDTFEKEKEIVKILSQFNSQYVSSDTFWKNKKRVLEISPSLNEDQATAAANAMAGSIIVTGGAGTGKTYTLQSIMAALPDSVFLLAAPTGKASRRIEQSLIDGGYTDPNGDPMTAQTVHRLLQYYPRTKSFIKNQWNKLEADYVIVDEFSMMDVALTESLLQAINVETTKLIMVGDHHQLPSVGCGNVLRDAIDCELLPVCKLETVMRQGGVLKEHSNAVLDGKVLPTKVDPENSSSGTQWIVMRKDSKPNGNRDSESVCMDIMRLLVGKRFEANNFEPLHDVQFLSSMRKGPLGTLELNKLLQTHFQKIRGNNIVQTEEGKKGIFHVGDKVIQTKNDYSIDVMNGTLGFIIDMKKGEVGRAEDGGEGKKKEDPSSEYLVIKFETGDTFRIKKNGARGSNIELAYVLTVHKVQGSEFPCVVFICHKLHTFMHHRGLLYTAVTRAKKSLILLGDKWGIGNCGKKVLSDKRITLMPILSSEHDEGEQRGGCYE